MIGLGSRDHQSKNKTLLAIECSSVSPSYKKEFFSHMEAHETKLLLNRLITLIHRHLVNPHTLPCSTGTVPLLSLGQDQKECSFVGSYRSPKGKQGTLIPLRYQGRIKEEYNIKAGIFHKTGEKGFKGKCSISNGSSDFYPLG